MIGESNRLGRDGIHYDLFIKAGRLNVTLSPATAGSHQPCNLQWWCQYHTRLALPSSPFKRRSHPESSAVFYFFILSTYNLLKRSIFRSCSTNGFCKTVVQ